MGHLGYQGQATGASPPALWRDLAAAQWQELVPESVKVRPASGTNRQL
jgi:hypothetical protein